MATATINRISTNGQATQQKANEVGKAKKKQVDISRPTIKLAKLKIAGMTDLICKKMSEKTTEALVSKQSKRSPKAKEARDPQQEYLDSLYVIGSKKAGTKGARYGFPYGGLKRSVQTAAGRFLKDGNSLNGMIVAGSLFVLPTDEASGLVEIKHAQSDLYMRSDQGRNPMSGGAIVIHRGAFTNWSMEFMVRYNESVLSIEQVVTLFMWAGFAVGLGEWRPEKGGTYGQFEVVAK